MAAACALALWLAAPATHGLTFNLGEMTGSFDSTFSAGVAYRLEDPARDLYGTTSTFKGVAGLAASVNGDDGDLNYGKGLYSEVIKGTHDLQLRYHDVTTFVRVTYFKDFEVGHPDHQRTPLSELGRRRVESNASLLDAYLSYKFTAGDLPVNLRVGSQVLSWGESTFIPNGINAINPVDVARLRMPGSELREALKPVPMVSGSVSLNQALSFDAYYLLAFKKTDIDPRGSYFSSNDFASFGGQNVFLGFGALPDSGTLGAVPRANDRYPRSSGQFGLALRYLASSLGDTEFGLYFERYHSRMPVISAITPTNAINTNLTGPLTAVFMSTGLSQAVAGAQAAGLWAMIVKSLTAPATLTPVEIGTLQAPQTQAAIAGAKKLAFLGAAGTGRYFIEYPDDISLVGVSFNTTLGKTGISLQGEISYKGDQPLQVDDVELLFAAMSALDTPGGTVYGANNQLGNYAGHLATEVSGYKRYDVWQAQATATKLFGRLFGASQWSLVGEIGAIEVPDLPAKDVLRFDGPGTYTSGSTAFMTNTGNNIALTPATPYKGFADRFSWGYQVLAKFDYNNLFAGVNCSPSISFAQDIHGNTPLPLGNFVSGRRTLSLGVEFTYQNKWALDLRYVNYSGAGSFNLIHDRDFIASTIKYSF